MVSQTRIAYADATTLTPTTIMTDTQRPAALITGASRGIGRAIAQALAPTHDLILTARDVNALAEVAAQATQAGASCQTVPLDLRSPVAVAKALKDFAPDVLINNAGVAVMKPFLELSPEEWQSQVDVNINALYHVTRAVLPAMVARGSGHVITIGSLCRARWTRSSSRKGRTAPGCWRRAMWPMSWCT